MASSWTWRGQLVEVNQHQTRCPVTSQSKVPQPQSRPCSLTPALESTSWIPKSTIHLSSGPQQASSAPAGPTSDWPPHDQALFILGTGLSMFKPKLGLDGACSDVCFLATLLRQVLVVLPASKEQLQGLPEQAQALQTNLASTLHVISGSMTPSPRDCPSKVVQAIMCIQNMHGVATKLLWQCGLSAEEVTEAVEEALIRLLPAYPATALAPASSTATTIPTVRGAPVWRVPQQQVDELVLSVSLADTQRFHEALWAITRTFIITRPWVASDILNTVPLILHNIISAADITTTSQLDENLNIHHSNLQHPAQAYLTSPDPSAVTQPTPAAAHLAAASSQLYSSLTPAAKQLWRRIHWDTFDLVAWKLRQASAAADGSRSPSPPTRAPTPGAGFGASTPSPCRGRKRSKSASASPPPQEAATIDHVVRAANFPAIATAIRAVQGLGGDVQGTLTSVLDALGGRPLGEQDITAAQQLLITAAVYNRACQEGLQWADGYVCTQAWVETVTAAALSGTPQDVPPRTMLQGSGYGLSKVFEQEVTSTTRVFTIPMEVQGNAITTSTKRGRGRPRKQRSGSPEALTPTADQQAKVTMFPGNTQQLLCLMAAAEQLQGQWSLPARALDCIDNTLVARWQDVLACIAAATSGTFGMDNTPPEMQNGHIHNGSVPPSLEAPAAIQSDAMHGTWQKRGPEWFWDERSALVKSTLTDSWLRAVWGWHVGSVPGPSAPGIHGTGQFDVSDREFLALEGARQVLLTRSSFGSHRPSTALCDLLLGSHMRAVDLAVDESTAALLQGSPQDAEVHDVMPIVVPWGEGAGEGKLTMVLDALHVFLEAHLDWQSQEEEEEAGLTGGNDSCVEDLNGHGSGVQVLGSQAVREARSASDLLLTKLLVCVAMLPEEVWKSRRFITQSYPALAQLVCKRMKQRPEQLLMDRFLEAAKQVLLSAHPNAPRPCSLPADALLSILQTATLPASYLLPDKWDAAADGAFVSIIESAAVTGFVRITVWATLLQTVAAAGWSCPRAATALMALAVKRPELFGPGLEVREVAAALLKIWPNLATAVSAAGYARPWVGQDVRIKAGIQAGPKPTLDQLIMFAELQALGQEAYCDGDQAPVSLPHC